jgi:hypothetical protein
MKTLLLAATASVIAVSAAQAQMPRPYPEAPPVSTRASAQSPHGEFTCVLTILTNGKTNNYTFVPDGDDKVAEIVFVTDGRRKTYKPANRPRWSYRMEGNLITIADLASPPYRIVILDKTKFDDTGSAEALFQRRNDSSSFFAIGECKKRPPQDQAWSNGREIGLVGEPWPPGTIAATLPGSVASLGYPTDKFTPVESDLTQFPPAPYVLLSRSDERNERGHR